MNKINISRVLATFFLILSFIPTLTIAEDLRPAMLANPCAGCHGPDGKSPGSIPSLNKLSGKYISISMKAFKSDQRKGTVMNRIAKGYSDEEIELMSNYFEKINKPQ